jgi:hypothetical protein
MEQAEKSLLATNSGINKSESPLYDNILSSYIIFFNTHSK